jgi:hypothetical protein
MMSLPCSRDKVRQWSVLKHSRAALLPPSSGPSSIGSPAGCPRLGCPAVVDLGPRCWCKLWRQGGDHGYAKHCVEGITPAAIGEGCAVIRSRDHNLRFLWHTCKWCRKAAPQSRTVFDGREPLPFSAPVFRSQPTGHLSDLRA